MEPLGVAVVIPTLDEAESIQGVVAEIPRDVVREIIVVDGGSRDGTAELAAAAGARIVIPGGPG
jgi:glycosyltransferase involved in cell wall biosynthesis